MAMKSAGEATGQERWTETKARAVIDAWRRSGRSVAAFAQTIGVVPQRLYWWKRQLALVGSGAPSLVPVVATAPSAWSRSRRGPHASSPANSTSRAAVVITSTSGVRIEVSEINASTAAWVVAVLGGEAGM